MAMSEDILNTSEDRMSSVVSSRKVTSADQQIADTVTAPSTSSEIPEPPADATGNKPSYEVSKLVLTSGNQFSKAQLLINYLQTHAQAGGQCQWGFSQW